MEATQLINVFTPAAIAFVIGILITPIITHFLYKHKVWKKNVGKTAMDGSKATEFSKLRDHVETKTPRMGGIVIWSSILLTTAVLMGVEALWPDSFLGSISFFSREQTWIPLATLLAGAVVGFVDDYIDITAGGVGLQLRHRLLFTGLLATLIGLWFFIKLDITSVHIPFQGPLEIGWLIVPLFVVLSLLIYASGVIDGIDGLSGGVFASVFLAYTGIAFYQNQFEIAALCAAFSGAILAFLWFNIPPARFWMTESGTMPITLSIAVIAIMTDTLGDGAGLSALPIVAFLLLFTVGMNIVQISAKKIWGRKVLRIAPFHHHLEAIGWPSYKVTMRYWVISMFCAIVGIIFVTIA